MLEDYTGIAPTHAISGEVIPLSAIRNSVFSLSKGAYYAESLRIRRADNGAYLTNVHGRSDDFKPRALDSAATGHSGKEVYIAVELKEVPVGDLIVDYQYVGGRYLKQLDTINRLIDNLEGHELSNILFSQLLNAPTSFETSLDHIHHARDIIGKDEEIAALVQIHNALLRLINEVTVNEESETWQSFLNLYQDIKDKIGGLDDVVGLVDGSIVVPSQTTATRPDITLPENSSKVLLHFNTDEGKLEYWNPLDTQWREVGSGSGGGVGDIVLVSEDTDLTLVSGTGYMATEFSANKTWLLPQNPEPNEYVMIGDLSGVCGKGFSIFVDGNGARIHGLHDELEMDNPNFKAYLTYIDEDRGWHITDGVGLVQGYLKQVNAARSAVIGVQTISGKRPDVNGNINLIAEDVKDFTPAVRKIMIPVNNIDGLNNLIENHTLDGGIF